MSDTETEILNSIQPIRTRDRAPASNEDGESVFAWDDRHKEYVIVLASSVAGNPKFFTHWLPKSILPALGDTILQTHCQQ